MKLQITCEDISNELGSEQMNQIELYLEEMGLENINVVITYEE